MGAIAIWTRFDEGTESSEVARSVKLRSHNTNCCLIEVVIKGGLTVQNTCNKHVLTLLTTLLPSPDL